jgi:tetratricopeptide (TPR) repeat protein
MRIKWPLFFREDTPKMKNTVYTKVSRREASNKCVEYGEDLANSNKLEQALESFDNAIRIDPRNDLAWGDKGLILDKLTRLDESLVAFSNAIKINRNNAITWNNNGLALLRLNRFNESIECFEEAIKIKPDYAKAWYNKGRCLSMMGKLSESQGCLDRAKKLDPLLFTKLRRLKSVM